MDFLLGLVKEKKDKKYKTNYVKLLSNSKVFNLPDDIGEGISYDTEYKLEDDEWFSVENFSQQPYCSQFLKNRFISTDYRQIKASEKKYLQHLVYISDQIFYFQDISATSIIKNKLLSLKKMEVEKESEIIIIKELPDCIYIQSKDTLFFKNLITASRIFKGMNVLYKEATKEEVTSFLENSFIKLENNFHEGKIKKANRKRISMTLEVLSKLSNRQLKNIFSYTRSYVKGLKYDDKNAAFLIENEIDLKNLMYGINERFYTTKQGKEKRVANSVRTI